MKNTFEELSESAVANWLYWTEQIEFYTAHYRGQHQFAMTKEHAKRMIKQCVRFRRQQHYLLSCFDECLDCYPEICSCRGLNGLTERQRRVIRKATEANL